MNLYSDIPDIIQSLCTEHTDCRLIEGGVMELFHTRHP